MVKAFILGIIIIIPSYYNDVYEDTGVAVGIVSFIMYVLDSVSFTFMFSTFFSKAKMATETYTMVFVFTILF